MRMKNKLNIILNFILVFIFYSCTSNLVVKDSNGEKTIFYSNYQIKFYTNGSIQSVGQLKDSLMVGQWTYFFENGIVKASGKFINGNGKEISEESNIPLNGRDGLWIFYNENGIRDGEYNYKAGKRDGIVKNWYEKGELKGIWNYVDGKKEGKQMMWFANGNKKYEGNYTSGKLDGPQKAWYENGSLKEYGNFKNGEISGEQIRYNEDGSILEKFVP